MLIVVLIKIVIEEYINHIAPYQFKFRLQADAFENSPGTARTGWPSSSTCSTAGMDSCPTRTGWADRRAAQGHPVQQPLAYRSRARRPCSKTPRQAAGRIGLFNTPDYLLPVEASASS